MPIIYGFLLEDDTLSHTSLFEKPNGFERKHATKNQTVLACQGHQYSNSSLVLHCLRLSFLLLLLDTPSGSYCKIAWRTSSYRNFKPVFRKWAQTLRYPILDPPPLNVASSVRILSTGRLNRLSFFKCLFIADKLIVCWW